MLFTDLFFDGWNQYLVNRRHQRVHRETVEEISALPAHIRRDIGWPGAYERQRAHRR
ncbi:MAG: hypothetical protein LJE67_09620 [Salaquimonas sp.]|jgi:hypothetical protein|nr:hypothetical protein [Salaquimonas sp.]